MAIEQYTASGRRRIGFAISDTALSVMEWWASHDHAKYPPYVHRWLIIDGEVALRLI